MSPKSTANRAYTTFELPPAVEGRAIPISSPPVDSLSHPELHRRAGQNRRRHAVRIAGRIAGLFAADMTAFLILRSVLHALRAGWVSIAWLDVIVGRVLYEGFLGGWRFSIALLISLIATGNYGAGDRRRNVGRILLASVIASSLALWASLWLNPPAITIFQFVATVALTSSSVALTRLGGDVLVRRVLSRRVVSLRTVLVGPADACLRMLDRLQRSRSDLDVVGFVASSTPSGARPLTPGLLGTIEELPVLLNRHRIDTVLLCGHLGDAELTRVVNAALPVECRILTGARTLSIAGVKPTVCWRRGEPFIELRHVELRVPQMVLKRLLDVIVSAAALLLLFPLLAAVALAVRIESRGSVLFRQRRLGRHGRPFECLKFRSMHVDAEQRLRCDRRLYELYQQNDFKLPEHLDPRVTRVGRVLRRTSLDELPQFWNVLRGDMSLVGPRPIVPAEIRHYNETSALLLSLKPGLTGEWQVRGRSALGYPARALVELAYVESWSITRDLLILLRTLPAVLLQRGAH